MTRTLSNVIKNQWLAAGLLALVAFTLLGGCDDDCVTCVDDPRLPPVAPTQVYSVSGDGHITLYWNDYPEIYDENLLGYGIWRRIYLDDHTDPAREFNLVTEVFVGDSGVNFGYVSGQWWYIDNDVNNAVDYEYAVSAFSDAGESYLSFELVIDTPLPMSETPLALHDVGGDLPEASGFDFSLAAEYGGYADNGALGIVDPTTVDTSADILVRFDDDGVPWLETVRSNDVRIQDYGTFLDGDGDLYFEGVSWAPEFGWSATGVVELIPGHIYVLEIYNEPHAGDIHYAKLGVTAIVDDPIGDSVRIMWAYQLVNGLPELSMPEPRRDDDQDQVSIRL